MSYNSGVIIVLAISNHSPDYSLNCTPLGPITITYLESVLAKINNDKEMNKSFKSMNESIKNREMLILSFFCLLLMTMDIRQKTFRIKLHSNKSEQHHKPITDEHLKTKVQTFRKQLCLKTSSKHGGFQISYCLFGSCCQEK